MILKVGDFRISPRPRYAVYEEEENINLKGDGSGTGATNCGTSSGSGSEPSCVSLIENREIIFKVRCLGHGDLAAADKSYRALEEFLAELCKSNVKEYYRRISTEEPLVYPIEGAYVKRIDIDLEYSCEAIKTGEVHLLTLRDEGQLEPAQYNLTVPKPGI